MLINDMWEEEEEEEEEVVVHRNSNHSVGLACPYPTVNIPHPAQPNPRTPNPHRDETARQAGPGRRPTTAVHGSSWWDVA
jgi:hypothetical protein